MFIGNKLCERDEDCCSNNCFKEQDNQKYGICEHPNEESKSRSDKEALSNYFMFKFFIILTVISCFTFNQFLVGSLKYIRVKGIIIKFQVY